MTDNQSLIAGIVIGIAVGFALGWIAYDYAESMALVTQYWGKF